MSEKKESNNDYTGRQIAITRLLNAPLDLVWQVWTKPEHIANWWGPTGFTNTISKMEVKPGGAWEHILHGPDGTDHINKVRFIEVVKHERLVFEHLSKPWHLTTVTFTAEGNKTRLHWLMLFETTQDFDFVVKVHKADVGLGQNIEKMERYMLNKNVADGQPLVIERTYNAPIAMVWNAITNNEAMQQWYFKLPEFKAEVGFEFEFNGGKDGRSYRHLCRVTEVEPGKKITYSWRYDGYEGISFVTWALFAEGDKTRLVLTHTGLQSFPASNPDFAPHNFNAGWNHITGVSLKDFLEKA